MTGSELCMLMGDIDDYQIERMMRYVEKCRQEAAKKRRKHGDIILRLCDTLFPKAG